MNRREFLGSIGMIVGGAAAAAAQRPAGPLVEVSKSPT